MVLARDLAASAQAVETIEAKQSIALVFHQVSRSMRLSLSLESRLNRERWNERADARQPSGSTARRRVACDSGEPFSTRL
jgi:hypothetical protein